MYIRYQLIDLLTVYSHLKHVIDLVAVQGTERFTALETRHSAELYGRNDALVAFRHHRLECFIKQRQSRSAVRVRLSRRLH